MMMMLLFERLEYDDDDVADQKVKVLKMLLIERSKDVADRKVKVLNMLLIESSKC